MRGKTPDVHGLGLALGHYCPADAGLDRVRGFAQEDPFEKRGDDSQIPDNSNAKVRGGMNPLVLFYSHL